MAKTRKMKWLSSVLLAAPLVLNLRAAAPHNSQQGGQTIRLNVEMVSLPVVVATRDGQRVVDLKQDDFQVLEDGVVQEIAGFGLTDEPISVALAIDTSGSVENQLGRMQNEAIHFVNLLHPDDSVAIMSFAEDVQLLDDWTIDRSRNERGIKESRHGTCTKLYEAVWLAFEEVLKPVQEKKALVLFTDGDDTASHKATREETIELAKEGKAAVYSVYFRGDEGGIFSRPHIQAPTTPPFIPQSSGSGCGVMIGGFPVNGHAYLTDLADYSGGRVFDARGWADLGPAFEQIAEELASQYSIGYYSTNKKHDGKFRKIEVKVKKPGLTARTKKGYYAPK
jgi:Ca-activated chloride channel family protein